jgi:hypothetical protein
VAPIAGMGVSEKIENLIPMLGFEPWIAQHVDYFVCLCLCLCSENMNLELEFWLGFNISGFLPGI